MPELEGLEYLREFPDFEHGNVSAAQTFGLERILALLHEVGSPHLRLPVVHIAGTKGKGSTAICVAGILRASGYVTGLFTQPHLLSVRERFQIDGVEITDAELSDIMIDRIRPAIRGLAARGVVGVQQFEAQVAVALLWFETHRVDVVVLEVGLGGRLDATNVVPAPLVSVLTSIGLDHTAILGNTLSLIAAEKAAIIKPGSIAVAAPQPAEAKQVFMDTAERLGVPLFIGERDWHVSGISVSLSGTIFNVDLSASMASYFGEWLCAQETALECPTREGSLFEGLSVPLLGAHQAVNAASAVTAAIAVAPRLERISVDTIRRGLKSVQWPGRLQIIAERPTLILDGAHTPESAAVLATAIRDLFPARRVFLVCGIQRDKDTTSISAVLGDLAHHVVATSARHPRAASADAIEAAFRSSGHRSVEACADPAGALAHARSLAGPEDVIVVTGSLYLVGEILKAVPKMGEISS
jgi:dihydrofolate synthase/folylpolyglutamate synthase